MSKQLRLSDRLDFSEIDLTAPDKVVEEILKQLPDSTNEIIYGRIAPYDGDVVSYTTKSLAEALGTIATEKYVDIQNNLGEIGKEDKKFECYLYTTAYTGYKYRLFFMRYGIANYPVDLTVEESIARSIPLGGSKYIITCNNREELEGLIYAIITSDCPGQAFL